MQQTDSDGYTTDSPASLARCHVMCRRQRSCSRYLTRSSAFECLCRCLSRVEAEDSLTGRSVPLLAKLCREAKDVVEKSASAHSHRVPGNRSAAARRLPWEKLMLLDRAQAHVRNRRRLHTQNCATGKQSAWAHRHRGHGAGSLASQRARTLKSYV